MEQETDFNITISIIPEVGDPDLYVKTCFSNIIEDCLFTDEEIESPDDFDIRSSIHNTGPE